MTKLILPVVGQSYFHKTENVQVVIESVCNKLGSDQFGSIYLKAPSIGGKLQLSLAGFSNLVSKDNLILLQDVAVQSYIIWNPSKIMNNEQTSHLDNDIRLLSGLVQVEFESESGWCSEVATDDIDALIQSFENEADATMSYCTFEEYKEAIKAYKDAMQPITMTVKELKDLKRSLYGSDYDCRNHLAKFLNQYEV